jgi:hypothetical protein
MRYTPSANDIPFTHVTVYGLAPGFFYLFRVASKNGVSSLADNSDNFTKTFAEISTLIPKPGKSYLFTFLS